MDIAPVFFQVGDRSHGFDDSGKHSTGKLSNFDLFQYLQRYVFMQETAQKIKVGISIGDLIFDCAYQFRYGNDVGGDVLVDVPSTSADVTQHLLMWSFIYHF